ncbi:hypothetical protein COCON_G00218620 [Conger conger]|uniref:Uncharacterized protein n=1 Tax=Conger conger TaxID=82655 RepID=A0A9Q1CYI7_CONCO|nr:hypothetical protein COCON_G00218620 [Conger conger]
MQLKRRSAVNAAGTDGFRHTINQRRCCCRMMWERPCQEKPTTTGWPYAQLC